jgi:hypothetical protein
MRLGGLSVLVPGFGGVSFLLVCLFGGLSVHGERANGCKAARKHEGESSKEGCR